MTVTRRHARAGLAACLVLLVGEMGLLAAAGRSDPPAQPTADPRLDAHGDPLPPGAVARIGTLRWRYLGSVRRVVPSPTGKLAAIEAAKTALMSLADGRVLGEIPRVDEDRFGCRFTPDGSRLMVLGGRGVVRFHDPTTGKVVAESRPVREKDTERRDGGRTLTTSHRFTEDARWVATTDPAPEGHTLTLTEVVAGPAARRQVRLEPPPEFGTAAEVFDFACDGATVVGAGRQHTRQSWDPVLFRWDLATGRLTTAVWPKVQENGFVLSPDGRRLVTWWRGLRVWDTATGAEAVGLEEPVSAAFGPSFAPDGRRLVAIIARPVDPWAVVVWDLASGRVVGRVPLPGRRYTYPFLLPDGRTLLVADQQLMVTTWDLATGRRLSPADGHERGLRHLAFSADGASLYTASSATDEPVTAWDPATGKRLRELGAPGGYSRFVLTDGGAVVTTSTEGPLVWADAATGRELRRAQPSPRMGPLGGPMHVAQLLPSRDPRTGRAAVFGLVPAKGGGRCLVAFWDAASGELLAERPLEDRRHAGAVAVSAAGRLLAREVTDLPPGVETADARDCMAVVIEDTLTGTGLLRVEQPDCLQRGSVGLTPDGHSLVTWTTAYPHGRHDGAPAGTTTVRLWEVRAGRQRLAFTLPVVGKEWADEPEASTVSADGRWLAGARRPDGTISVWDLATGAEVAKRSGYGTPVECLAFRPDGKALASGHDDGTALVWDLSGLAPIKPAATNREAAWTDLAADAERAYRAVLALAADPGCAAFLRGRVKPTAAAPADEVARLVGELDSADFATRERATAALAKLGDGAAAGLRAALAGDLSAEQRRRVESVLGKWGPAVSDPERLRALRCVEALERSGTAEARALLAELAGGAAGARLTREAADALRRPGPAPRKPD